MKDVGHTPYSVYYVAGQKPSDRDQHVRKEGLDLSAKRYLSDGLWNGDGT